MRCCTTLPSTIVSTTSRTLARLGNRYSPDLSSVRALSATTPPRKTSGCSSITPSFRKRSAISVMPRRGEILTTFSASSGPGASKRALPTAKAMPPAIVDKHQQSEDGVADNDQRISHPLGAPRRDRHMFGLQRSARTARRHALVHDGGRRRTRGRLAGGRNRGTCRWSASPPLRRGRALAVEIPADAASARRRRGLPELLSGTAAREEDGTSVGLAPKRAARRRDDAHPPFSGLGLKPWLCCDGTTVPRLSCRIGSGLGLE